MTESPNELDGRGQRPHLSSIEHLIRMVEVAIERVERGERAGTWLIRRQLVNTQTAWNDTLYSYPIEDPRVEANMPGAIEHLHLALDAVGSGDAASARVSLNDFTPREDQQ